MDFQSTKPQQEIQEKAKLFASEHVAPHVKRLEEDLAYRRQLFTLMARNGLFLLGVPAKLGGTQLDTISFLLALKEIARADAGIAVAMAVTNMVAEAIARYGTDGQRQKYLQRISEGIIVPCAFALTEKSAGSDAKSIKMRAYPDPADPNYFVLEGEKHLITNADMAGVVIVMAKTDPESSSRGVSAFLIDRGTPGFQIVKKENKLGLLTANLVGIKFENCRIPRANLLGKEGEGLHIALSALDNGRMGVAAQAIGLAESAFEAALAYAKSREQFGGPIARQQAIAFKLADMQVKLSASRLLMCKAAWLRDQGLPFNREASEAKLYCSESANEIASEALQIHGGYGYTKDYPVEKYFRDARVTTIYEGTSEIQRLIISRDILKER